MTKEELILQVEQGLEHFDGYERRPTENTAIYAVPADECLYEFAHERGQLQVRHLRAMLKFLKEDNDGNA